VTKAALWLTAAFLLALVILTMSREEAVPGRGELAWQDPDWKHSSSTSSWSWPK
jgi:hypothetical protein